MVRVQHTDQSGAGLHLLRQPCRLVDLLLPLPQSGIGLQEAGAVLGRLSQRQLDAITVLGECLQAGGPAAVQEAEIGTLAQVPPVGIATQRFGSLGVQIRSVGIGS